jgi:hypothetical protein
MHTLFIHLLIIGNILFLVHLNHVHDVCMNMTIFYQFYVLFLLAARACFCNPCFTARLTDRVGDHLLTCCLNPSSLMAVRTKVRTAYKIDVNEKIYCFLYCSSSISISFVFLGKFNRRLLCNNMLRMPMCCYANWERTQPSQCSSKTCEGNELNSIWHFCFFD